MPTSPPPMPTSPPLVPISPSPMMPTPTPPEAPEEDEASGDFVDEATSGEEDVSERCALLSKRTNVRKLDNPEWCNEDLSRRLDPSACESAYVSWLDKTGAFEVFHFCEFVEDPIEGESKCLITNEPFTCSDGAASIGSQPPSPSSMPSPPLPVAPPPKCECSWRGDDPYCRLFESDGSACFNECCDTEWPCDCSWRGLDLECLDLELGHALIESDAKTSANQCAIFNNSSTQSDLDSTVPASNNVIQ
eukprot:6193576-Pleurochrysis_carterae.AAC.2